MRPSFYVSLGMKLVSDSEPLDKNKLAPFLSPEADQFVRRFSTYTERGAALAVVAGLDAELQMLLKSVMVDEEAIRSQMFSEQGTLGQFGAKVRIGYLFNLLSKTAYQELIVINRIRNAFAHEAEANDFSFRKIQGLASGLKIFRARSEFFRDFPDRVGGWGWDNLFSRLKWGIGKPNYGFVAECLVLESNIQDTLAKETRTKHEPYF